MDKKNKQHLRQLPDYLRAEAKTSIYFHTGYANLHLWGARRRKNRKAQREKWQAGEHNWKQKCPHVVPNKFATHPVTHTPSHHPALRAPTDADTSGRARQPWGIGGKLCQLVSEGISSSQGKGRQLSTGTWSCHRQQPLLAGGATEGYWGMVE